MTPTSSLLPVRRRADALDRRLDAGLAATGASDAVALTLRLRALGTSLSAGTAPREQFRADLRTRLMAVAAVQAAVPAGTAVPARPALPAAMSSRASSRAAGALAGAMASVVALTGVAVAGSQSLPGEPFYGVKRGTEAVVLRLSDGQFDRGMRHLDQAATRLREIRGLVLGRDALAAGGTRDAALVAGSAPLPAVTPPGSALGPSVARLVQQTLADMDADTRTGWVLLDGAFRSSRDTAPLRALSRFATRQGADLEQLLPSLPVGTRDRARTSLALVATIAQDTEQQLAATACGVACDPASSAPSAPAGLPPVANPLEPGPVGAPSEAPCGCQPGPAPLPREGVQPGPIDSGPTASTEPMPSSAADPAGSSGPTASDPPAPTPSASPSGDPQPLPSTPVPLPSLSPLPAVTSLLPEPIATLLPSLPPSPLLPPLPFGVDEPDPLLSPLLPRALVGALQAEVTAVEAAPSWYRTPGAPQA